MLECGEKDVLKVFEKVHGPSDNCRYEVIYDDRGEILAVAVMKDGLECWRATVAELALDFSIIVHDMITNGKRV